MVIDSFLKIPSSSLSKGASGSTSAATSYPGYGGASASYGSSASSSAADSYYSAYNTSYGQAWPGTGQSSSYGQGYGQTWQGAGQQSGARGGAGGGPVRTQTRDSRATANPYNRY